MNSPPTPKLRGRKSATTDGAHHWRSLSGLVSIVVVTFLYVNGVVFAVSVSKDRC